MADVEVENEGLAGINNFADLLKANDGQMPSRKQILEMLDGSDMNEELKESLRTMMKGNAPEVFGSSGGTWLGVVFVIIIFSLMFFFGYKLYKSIKDKEIKKEEKKKAKQMKKKK